MNTKLEIMDTVSQVGTFGTESAVRKRGGSRNLPYLNAKPRQIPLLGTYAWTVTMGKTKRKIVKKILKFLFVYDTMNGWDNCPADSYVYMYEDGVITMISSGQGEIPYRRYSPRTMLYGRSGEIPEPTVKSGWEKKMRLFWSWCSSWKEIHRRNRKYQ